jgi:predicted lipoprotein with Yx(FWY)xxD motif
MQQGTLRVFLAALVVAAAAVVGGATASTGGLTVGSARNGTLGEILVSSAGRTLYHTSSEKPGAIRCTGACTLTWPPLLVPAHAKPVAGPGVTASKLGTVRRPNGQLQVSYGGLALYFYSGDTKAGQVNGQGMDGVWHALTPAGAAVSKALTAAKAMSGGTSSTSSADQGTGTSSMSNSTGSSSTASTGTSSTGSNTTSGSSAGAGMWCAANPSQCVNGVPVTPAG